MQIVIPICPNKWECNIFVQVKGPIDKDKIWAEKSYSQPIFYPHMSRISWPFSAVYTIWSSTAIYQLFVHMTLDYFQETCGNKQLLFHRWTLTLLSVEWSGIFSKNHKAKDLSRTRLLFEQKLLHCKIICTYPKSVNQQLIGELVL